MVPTQEPSFSAAHQARRVTISHPFHPQGLPSSAYLQPGLGRMRSATMAGKRKRAEHDIMIPSFRLEEQSSFLPPFTSPLFSPSIAVPISPLSASTSASSRATSPYHRETFASDERNSSAQRRRAFSDLPSELTVQDAHAVRLQRSTPRLPADDRDLFSSPLVCRRLRPLESSRPSPPAIGRRRSGTVAVSNVASNISAANARDSRDIDAALAQRGIMNPDSDAALVLASLAQSQPRVTIKRSASDDSIPVAPIAEEVQLRHSASATHTVMRLPSIRELASQDSPPKIAVTVSERSATITPPTPRADEATPPAEAPAMLP